MQRAVRRNTLLLSAALAANSVMLQLQAAVASLTLVLVVDVEQLLGLGPAVALASGAMAALPAGRAMDRFGRVPVLATGYALGLGGCLLAALGSATGSPAAVLPGLAATGAASGIALLSRTAAGDMQPPERRARGVAMVLFGAVFGAILGPTVLGPLVAGRDLDGSALALLWSAAAGFMAVALALVLAVRPDPRDIARQLQAGDVAAPQPAAPLAQILRRPGVLPALIAGQASFAVMVGLMTLTGSVMVDHHGHPASHVFPVIAAHVVGMYALALVVGDLVDRVGRSPALIGGLSLMAASAGGLAGVESVAATAAVLLALGLGWNLAFVAATAELADRTSADERGRLLGFNDLLSGGTGAGLALGGGLVLTELGVAHLALAGTALVALPAVWLAYAPARRPARVGG